MNIDFLFTKMMPEEILEVIALSTYENIGLTMTFCLRRLINYNILDKFSRIIGQRYVLPNGKFHTPKDREPIEIDGVKAWFRYGKNYRYGDLPAEIWKNGTRFWYINGKITTCLGLFGN
jgi:hypothetical protein